jgi:hypothetical protein
MSDLKAFLSILALVLVLLFLVIPVVFIAAAHYINWLVQVWPL